MLLDQKVSERVKKQISISNQAKHINNQLIKNAYKNIKNTTANNEKANVKSGNHSSAANSKSRKRNSSS